MNKIQSSSGGCRGSFLLGTLRSLCFKKGGLTLREPAHVVHRPSPFPWKWVSGKSADFPETRNL